MFVKIIKRIINTYNSLPYRRSFCEFGEPLSHEEIIIIRELFELLPSSSYYRRHRPYSPAYKRKSDGLGYLSISPDARTIKTDCNGTLDQILDLLKKERIKSGKD